jgi:hypothetical protein
MITTASADSLATTATEPDVEVETPRVNVASGQDLSADAMNSNSMPIDPIHSAHPAHPVHPVHLAHPVHPAHPAHPVHLVHPVHPVDVTNTQSMPVDSADVTNSQNLSADVTNTQSMPVDSTDVTNSQKLPADSADVTNSQSTPVDSVNVASSQKLPADSANVSPSLPSQTWHYLPLFDSLYPDEDFIYFARQVTLHMMAVRQSTLATVPVACYIGLWYLAKHPDIRDEFWDGQSRKIALVLTLGPSLLVLYGYRSHIGLIYLVRDTLFGGFQALMIHCLVFMPQYYDNVPHEKHPLICGSFLQRAWWSLSMSFISTFSALLICQLV